MKFKYSKLSISLAGALAVLLCGAAYVIASDGMTASPNVPISINGPDGLCRTVTNATSLSEYVPTATVGMAEFLHAPSRGSKYRMLRQLCGAYDKSVLS